MGCVFVLLCVPHVAKGQNVYLSARLNKTLVVCVCLCVCMCVCVCVCVSVCLFQIRVTLNKV